MATDDSTKESPTMLASGAVAVLYGGASVVMVLSNKALLSSWAFDFTCTLLLLQSVVTLAALAALRAVATGGLAKALAFPLLDPHHARTTAPIALAYLANVGCGLAALRLASVPVYQVLKRLAPLPAMFMDSVFRGATFSPPVRASVFLVAGGAVLTGFGDAAFDPWAYSLALTSCVLQALYLVITSRAGDLGLSALGVLHYNSLLSLPPLLTGAALEAPRALAFEGWASRSFVLLLSSNVALGGGLAFLLFLCSQLNSPVTTLIVGNIKALLTTALGFVLFGRVRLGRVGLLGVALNSAGGIWYSVAKYTEHAKKQRRSLTPDESFPGPTDRLLAARSTAADAASGREGA